jgi:LL-diaminopimelate aminotransferase
MCNKKISMQTAKRLESINEYYFSQKLREIDDMNKAGKDVINLGIGSPDLPPHPDVIKVLNEESVKPNVHAYQNYKGSPVLRNAMSEWYKKWYNVSLDANTEILPLIGSKEGIMHICMTYLNEGDVALIPNPGYPTYRSAVTLAGGLPVDYELTIENNWMPDFEKMEKQDLSTVKLMFINYPQMPTGQLPSKNTFEAVIAFAKKHNILLVHDNPYSFILNEEPMSLLSVPGAINEVLKFKSNMDSGMFLPMQLAAAKALSLDADWYKVVNDVYKKRRQKVFELLELLNCSFSKTQGGMFVWASIPAGYKDGYALSDEILQNANVFITPGGIFGSQGNNYVRVSLCSTEQKIEEAIKRIKA